MGRYVSQSQFRSAPLPHLEISVVSKRNTFRRTVGANVKMKPTALFLTLFWTTSCIGQTFSFSDTTFVVGSIHTMPPFEENSRWLQLEIERMDKVYDTIVDFLKRNPQLTIEFGIHMDVRGSAEYNQAFSDRRARYVREDLLKRGVSEKQVTVVGYGETKPIYDKAFIENLTAEEAKEEAHYVNRRIELKILEIK